MATVTYGFDGGRRWRKDYLNGVWTRYPCGVACGAGELVEQQKPLEGGTWTTSTLYLQGISLVRRNGEWHHFDPLGTAGVITSNTAAVISNNLYDVFGVERYRQGSAETPWRWMVVRIADEADTVLFHSQLGIVGRGIWLGSHVTSNSFFSAWSGWVRPFVTPVCLGCLGGFAAPLLALIMDCGAPNPFNTQWRECVGNAVDAFKEECKKDAICSWILKGCLWVCGGSVLIGFEKPEQPEEPVKKRHTIPRYKRLDISQW